jgi:hypothetical protein
MSFSFEEDIEVIKHFNRDDDVGITTEEIVSEAIKLGVPPERAVEFENCFQLEALKLKVPLEKALEFENIGQLEALKLKVPFELALEFENYFQLEAVRLDISPEIALKFINYAQIDALKSGITAEIALQFKSSCQERAYRNKILDLEDSIDFGVKDENLSVAKLSNVLEFFTTNVGEYGANCLKYAQNALTHHEEMQASGVVEDAGNSVLV